MDFYTITLILVIIFLLIISAFFSGSETALTAASRPKMYQLEKENNLRAKIVNFLKNKKERLIGTLLLGNNLVNTLATAIATSFFINLLGDNQKGILYSTIVMTLLILIFGEVLPKTIAINKADKFALLFAPFIKFLVTILSPFTYLINFFTRIILKLFKFEISTDISTSEDELRGTIDLHAKSEGSTQEKDMLQGILDLDDLQVKEIMTHRKNIEVIYVNESINKNIKKILNSQFTRLPLYDKNSDKILGIINVKDVLKNINKKKKLDLKLIAKNAWFIPETTSVLDQLQEFKKKQRHLAFVVDEYGALMGIVTLEDIIEEIVGDIEDEHDIKIKGAKKSKDGKYTISGNVTIRDINREFGWNLPDKDASTLAGLIFHEIKTIPEPGKIFSFYGFRFEIINVRKNHIELVRVIPLIN
jgi:Mg2+/Co2+ transporter CorB